MRLKKLYPIFIVPYTVFLLYMMFFGFGRTPMEDQVVRVVPIGSTIRMVENGILWTRYWSLFINIIGNVIMFVPFGFLGWMFPKLQSYKTLMISFLSVLFVAEALQYFSRLGVFDVDDLILNSFGVTLGYLVFCKVEQIPLSFTGKSPIK